MTSPPTPTRNASLRKRIWLLVVALAAPLLFLQTWWSYHTVLDARDQAEQNALAVADAVTLGVEQFLSSSTQMVGATASVFGTESFTEQSCAERMRTAVEHQPFLFDALAVDEAGTIACSARGTYSSPSVAGHPWWSAFDQGSNLAVGDPGALGDGWIMPLAAPLTDESGRFEGAIVGLIDPARLNGLIGALGAEDDRLITVATADRIVITRSEEPEIYLGRSLPALNDSDREVTPGRWSARGPDLDGVPRVWGQVETDVGWIVYVGVPSATVYGPAIASSVRTIGATLLVLLLGISFAGHSYRRIARSLEELATGARHVAGGDMVPLPRDTPEEVSALVEEFNDVLKARDRAQAAERKARERFESLFDNAVFGLCVSTEDGRFLQANPALAEMLGYSSMEALLDAGLAALYADKAVHAGHQRTAFDEGTIMIHGVEWIRADGRLITVRLGGKLIAGPGGAPVLELIVDDVTDAKRIEDELLHTQKMDAIGQLAGGVAHNFNNLLTVIGGNVELLEDDLPDGDALHEDLAQIAKATTRASSLTRRLLSFSRSERRGAEVRNVNGDILELKKLLVPLIGEDVILDTALTTEPMPVRIELSEFEQVILNLVLNSRDAMPSGGSLTIATGAGHLDDAEGGSSDAVRISVIDTGVGMNERAQRRIFEPFYTTKPRGSGTGLGLSTVYGIVKRLDGQLHVESSLGEGTTISVVLPLAGVEPTASLPIETAPAPSGDERVLVVEDDALVCRFVERALTDAGYEVTTAAAGAEALKTIEAGRRPPDIVLTDVVMPGMTGPELAERLAVVSPRTPVLFMSGYADRALLGRDLEHQPELLLRKPFTTQELRIRVREALDRAGQRSIYT